MTLNLSIPKNMQELRPKITVIGVGGAGCNAVNNMIEADLEGIDFLVANTDGQALASSNAPRKIQLGSSLTGGLGAGSKPKIGEAAAEESQDEIKSELADCNMIFITAGMGGGTGTGAAPIISKIAKEKNILTVGVVTKPFDFEGQRRMKQAEDGIKELQNYVDTLIVIPNQNLFRLANERTTFADAFNMADTVLHQAVTGVTNLMIKPGLINLDFADIKSVMSEMGKAMMGTGEGSGEHRAREAADAAINNPLLDDITIKGANSVLINVTGGLDMTLFEVDEAASRIREEVDHNATIIFGSAFDDKLDGTIRVSVVATGINANVKTNETDNVMNLNEDTDNNIEKPTIFMKVNKFENETVDKVNEVEKIKTLEKPIEEKSADEKQIDIEEIVKEKVSKETSIKADTLENNSENQILSHKQGYIFKRDTYVPETTHEIENVEESNINTEFKKDIKPSLIKKISGLWSTKNDADTQLENQEAEKISFSKHHTENETKASDQIFSLPNEEANEKKSFENYNIENQSLNNKIDQNIETNPELLNNTTENDLYPPSSEKKEDEDLEIPAFLRRQAN